MRCPKCSYLSYEEVARCRNCGYDFSLAAPHETPVAPTLDSPGEPRAWQGPTSRTPRAPTDLMAPEQEGAAVDLPLFEPPAPSAAPRQRDLQRDDPPLAIPPAPPPLVVRRNVDVARPATPAGSRPVARGREDTPPALDFDGPLALGGNEAPTPAEGTPWLSDTDREAPAVDDRDDRSSAQGARVVAGLIDAVIVLGIDAIVVWLTLRLLGLTPADWPRLPVAPLVGFLYLLDTSYLVTFTAASGQTIGKMVMGVRVVTEAGGRVPFGHAVLRSAVVLLCAAPAGLGLLPIFLDGRGRGLHDRVAGTRVGASR
jgi:uncharacterized RDD family membrane protein YckC